ncbi:MAG: putative Zn-dependent protease [Parvicella sp.]|jgi:predicted Zn-dependent protease
MAFNTVICLSKRAQALVLLVLSIALSGCATNPVTGKKDFVLMSEEQEVQLGKQSHGQILKQYQVYDNPALAKYVNDLGQKLAKQSHRSNLDFKFTLLDSPEVNAFALPGGYVYITRGIMAYLNSEEELAGVIGHEIGHVTARHGVRQQSAAQAGGFFGVLVAVATGNQQVAQTTSMLSSAIVSGYGRNHELEADRLGAEYLAKVNYDPESMLNVIGVLKDQEQFNKQKAQDSGKQASSYHGVFSSHPDNDSRLQEVIRAAKKFQNPDAVHSDPQTYLKLTDGMVFGNSESQGIVEGNQFYHLELDLKLTFPDQWQLRNMPDKILSIAPSQKQMMQFLLESNNKQDPRAFLRKNFPELEQEKRINANAASAVTALDTPWGKKVGRVAAVKRGDNMYVLMGVGEQTMPDSVFFQTVKSLKRLSSSDKKLARSKKIHLVRAKQGDTYAKLAQQSSISTYEIEQLRLINDDYPNGEPIVGELIKIVR